MEPLRRDDPTQLGPYRTVARLDRADGLIPATARRFIAHDVHGDRTGLVVVPLTDREANPGYGVRFRAEAEQARRLLRTSKWLSPVSDIASAAEPLPWWAAPYTPALPLPAVLNALGGTLPERTVRAVGSVLAETLAKLHADGFAYAGLSPTDVLLTGFGVRLTGFGAVRVAAPDGDDRSRLPELDAGSTAPEQLAGGRPRPLGDVYALGAVLAYASTGDVRAQHGALPENLRDLIRACMAHDPAHRPRADEALEALLRGAGSQAHAPAGELPTTLDGISSLEPDSEPRGTVLDSEWSRAAALFQPGWLPARAIAALARQSAEVLFAEVECPEPSTGDDAMALGQRAFGSDSTLGSGDEATVSEPPGPGAGTGSASDVVSSGVSPRPQRRAVLVGAASVVAGTATGFGGVTALGSDGAATSAFRPRKVSGVPPVPLWKHALQGDPPKHGPSVWQDKVVAVHDGADVVGIDMRSGKKKWTAEAVAPAAPAVDVGGDLIMLPAVGPPSFLSPRTGKVRWRENAYDETGGKGELTQIIGARGGVVWLVVVTEADFEKSAHTVAYDVDKRRELWRTPFPEGFYLAGVETARSGAARPLNWKKSLVLPQSAADTSGGRSVKDEKLFFALDPSNGTELWQKKVEGVTLESPVVPLSDGAAMAAVGDSLRAFSLPEGEDLWKAEVPSDALGWGTPAVHGDTVFAADTLSTVSAFRRKTGEVLWHSDPTLLLVPTTPASIRTLVTPSGRTVLVANAEEIVAFRAADGHVLWRFSDVSGVDQGSGAEPGRRLAVGDGVMIVLHGRSVYALPVD